MMYLKLSIRNARRSFINYLLYAAAMTVLLAIIEVSNCITIVGGSAGFQVISLPLLIAVIQIVLVGYIDTFMLKQRAKELASYLLLGMERKRLIRLFLCEVLLIGFCCCLAGTTLGFSVYGFRITLWQKHVLYVSVFLPDRNSVFYLAKTAVIQAADTGADAGEKPQSVRKRCRKL